MSQPFLHQLVPQYITPNPMRAITATAEAIAAAHKIEPVRAHLGNPTAPLHQPAIEAMVASLRQRGVASEENGYTSGYDNHAGDLARRKRVAQAVTKIDGLPEGTLDENNTFACNAGTGGLNAIFAIARPGSVVFVPNPTYPAWEKIASRYNMRLLPFDLKPENNFLPDADQIKKLMDENPARAVDPSKPGETGTHIVLYHYRNNPSGKTLSEADAKKVADTMRDVTRHQPNSLLVQEDIYIATTHPDDAIVSPTKYFDRDTLNHLVLIHSMSKAGHPQERTGIIAAADRTVAKHLMGAISFLTLGGSSTDFVAITETLCHIAEGGLKKRSESDDPTNYRYKVADYYQKRRDVLSKGLCEVEEKLKKAGVTIDPAHPILDEVNPDLPVAAGQEYQRRTPRGSYYLLPNFVFMRGKEIPVALREAQDFKDLAEKRRQAGVEDADVFRIQSGDDLALMLNNAHYLGLRPVTTAPGTLFCGKGSMRLRISAIDPNLEGMKDIANTITGIAQEVMDVDLGARRYSTNIADISVKHAEPAMSERFIVKLQDTFAAGQKPGQVR